MNPEVVQHTHYIEQRRIWFPCVRIKIHQNHHLVGRLRVSLNLCLIKHSELDYPTLHKWTKPCLTWSSAFKCNQSLPQEDKKTVSGGRLRGSVLVCIYFKGNIHWQFPNEGVDVREIRRQTAQENNKDSTTRSSSFHLSVLDIFCFCILKLRQFRYMWQGEHSQNGIKNNTKLF